MSAYELVFEMMVDGGWTGNFDSWTVVADSMREAIDQAEAKYPKRGLEGVRVQSVRHIAYVDAIYKTRTPA